MSLQTIPAIYESGVFKPLQPIKLHNHQKIRLIVETEEDFSSFLTPEEILSLANKRAIKLRQNPREVVVKQHQELIKALQAEAVSKGVEIDDYPDGD
ncbi:MAG: antitoxin family protein [bacterium]|nr:antitoxin family protein [bacterium]